MSSLLSLQFWWTDLSLPEVGSWLCGVREYSLRSWWFWLRGQTRWGRDLGQDQSRCETCEGIFNTNSGFYTLVCMLCLCIYLYYKVAQSLFLDQLHASVYLFYFYHKYGAWDNREFVPNLSHSLCSLVSSHRKKTDTQKEGIDCLWRHVLWFDTQPVLSHQVFAEATLVFPLLVAETFALHAEKKTTNETKEWIESSWS